MSYEDYPMPKLENQADLDIHQERILDYALDIGPQRWLKLKDELVETTDDPRAKDLIQFSILFIMYKAIDKIKQLEELEDNE